jgi:hypothetical protein
MNIIPKSTPQIKRVDVVKVILNKLSDLPKLAIIGVRGYYSKSMGATDGNDINLYDDAIIVVASDDNGDSKAYQTFNANTDPSFVKKGGRSLAKLNTGNYKFYKGRHKGQYNALRAFPEGIVLDCTRDGKAATCSFINIHKGGVNASSKDRVWSEGCQTLPTTQWQSFIELVYKVMLAEGLKTVDYILIDNEELQTIVNS